MTDDQQKTPPTTSTEPGAEAAPTPPETEARKLTVDDVEAGDDVKGGAVAVGGVVVAGDWRGTS
ncbi:MAG: hypothetical protein H6742_09585 [Alphaproteobacteria bacterium]|nr:hypothetical protein [Alphaproteobacteria bacterium]